MELCTHCGNPTAGDVTGTLYCVNCGMICQPTVRQWFQENSSDPTSQPSPPTNGTDEKLSGWVPWLQS